MGRFLLAGIGVGIGGWLWADATERVLARHAPVVNGTLEGSVQQMTGENVVINGGAVIHGDLLVPGLPAVRVNGRPEYAGTVDGTGDAVPAHYRVTVNGRASLRHVVRRTDPVSLPVVEAPPLPSGRHNVSINRPGRAPADFSEVRNLTINGKAVAVPPGTYGSFTVNGGGSLVLGAADSVEPARYGLQRLVVNGNADLRIAGPVELTVAHDVVFNGGAGSTDRPDWLRLQVAHGGVTLNGRSTLWGRVVAPEGRVIVNGGSRLVGGLVCDRLTIGGGGWLKLTAANQPPTVTITAPADGASLMAFTALTLEAQAGDPDGSVTRLEFFDGSTSLGEGAAVEGKPGSYALTLAAGLPDGTYALSAKATDNDGACTASAPIGVSVTLNANEAPQVSLTDPVAGAVIPAGTSVGLSATASDPDGQVVRVEFFDGSTLLGAATDGSSGTYSWTVASGLSSGGHTLTARAYDDDGAHADSAPVAVVVPAGVPYRADFEAAEGYVSGPLDGQLGWKVEAGTAAVTGETGYSGTQSVALAPGAPRAAISQTFAAPDSPGVLFVDLFAMPVAETPVDDATMFDVESSRFALLRDGSSGRLWVDNGDGLGGGQWMATDFAAPLAADQQTGTWIRFTARLDFPGRTWDLYADGRLVATDLAFRDRTATSFRSFSVRGHAAATSRLDYLLVTDENPLFADADRDGMDDAWEEANGLDPAVNDRNGDLDGDGLSNLREFQLGLKPNQADSDGDGLYDGDEVVWGWGPLTPNPDTVPPTAPTGLAATATADTVSLTWQPATDNLRVAGYIVYRNGQPLATAQPIRETHHMDTGLPDNAVFGYAVRAYDFSGNLSPLSVRVEARTVARDADGNGLPDYWENRYFPAGNVDPDADSDGDGLTNLQELGSGTDPTDFYNGILPVHEVLYGGRPGPDDQLAMIVRKPDGSPWPNAPVNFDITSGRRRLSATPGGPYSYHVTVRADADGLAQAFLEPLEP